MRTSYPVELDAVILGKSREAGNFEVDGRKVEFGDAYDLSFESSDGLTQTVSVPLSQLDDAADTDLTKLGKFASIKLIGDLVVNEGHRDGQRFTSVRLVPTTIKAPANGVPSKTA